MATTLLQLRERAQVLSDLKGTDFLSTAEWLPLINDGIRAVYSEVVALCVGFRVTTAAFSITNIATPTYALPTDFRSVFAVVLDPGLTTERRLNRYAPRSAMGRAERSYRIDGRNVVIEPRARALGNYRLDYTPAAVELVADIDAMDVELEMFEDAVALSAAVSALASDQRDFSQQAAMLGAAMDRVRAWASDQRSADPDEVEDVRGGRGNDFSWGIW